MTGEKLKQIIAGCGYSQKELSKRMSTIKHEQDFTRIFKSDDVKSGVIEDLARVLGRTMGEIYEDIPVDATRKPAGESQYLDLIRSRDRQIDKLQLQIDKLLDLLGKKPEDN